MILDSGEVVIYFNEDEWIELSRLLWEDRIYTAQEAVKEAVIPLLAEKEELKRRARRGTLIGLGGIAIGVGALILAAVVN